MKPKTSNSKDSTPTPPKEPFEMNAQEPKPQPVKVKSTSKRIVNEVTSQDGTLTIKAGEGSGLVKKLFEDEEARLNDAIERCDQVRVTHLAFAMPSCVAPCMENKLIGAVLGKQRAKAFNHGLANDYLWGKETVALDNGTKRSKFNVTQIVGIRKDRSPERLDSLDELTGKRLAKSLNAIFNAEVRSDPSYCAVPPDPAIQHAVCSVPSFNPAELPGVPTDLPPVIKITTDDPDMLRKKAEELLVMASMAHAATKADLPQRQRAFSMSRRYQKRK